MSNQKGFTLIELIVVIVILGILAATALPKFVDLSSDARGGVVKGVEASMRGANTMLYGKAAAQSLLSGSQALSANGVTVNLTNGYARDAVELAKMLDLSPATDFISATTAVTNGPNGYIGHNGAATPSTTCRIGYTQATAGGVPSYDRNISNCN